MDAAEELERLTAILDDLLRRLANATDHVDLVCAAGIARQELEGVTED